MSLLRLLTTGKTLVDPRNSTGRYRVPGKSLMPKFSSAKNPFVTPAKSQPVKAAEEISATTETPEATTAMRAAAQLKETKRIPMPSVKMKETKRLPFVAARNGAQKQTKPAVWQNVFGSMGAMIGKLNPLSWRAERKPSGKSAIPRFDKSAVQGELSLDNIKVVRNDLNDADMEIVQATPHTGQTNFKPALMPENRKAESEKAETQVCAT